MDDDQSENEEFSIAGMVESTIKTKDDRGLYTVSSPRISQGKFCTESTKTFPSISVSMPYISKIKTYYIEEIVKGMSG